MKLRFLKYKDAFAWTVVRGEAGLGGIRFTPRKGYTFTPSVSCHTITVKELEAIMMKCFEAGMDRHLRPRSMK